MTFISFQTSDKSNTGIGDFVKYTMADLTDKNFFITQKQYNKWAQQSVFDGLKGSRPGQSFCNYFGITDHILYYQSNSDLAMKYILDTYVRIID